MTDKDIRNVDVRSLLPQQPPFVMIDRLLHLDDTATVAEFKVRPDCIFVDDGQLLADGMTECIAQTCAARIGYINVYILKKSVKLGVIGAVRNLAVARRPRVGEVIDITITVREEVFRMILADARIEAGGETIVTAEMKIALSDTDMAQDAATDKDIKAV